MLLRVLFSLITHILQLHERGRIDEHQMFYHEQMTGRYSQGNLLPALMLFGYDLHSIFE